MNQEQLDHFNKLNADKTLDEADVFVQYVVKFGMTGDHYDELTVKLKAR